MRTYQIESYSGPDGLRLVERPEPKPGFGQVLVRIYATSLNYRDLIVVNGQYNQSPRPQLIPMSDGAGEVVEIGSGGTRFKVGDRVAGIFMQTWIGGEITL